MAGIVVEDGTVVTNANSFISTADADAYWADRGDSVWSGYSGTQKQTAVLKAGDYLKSEARFEWRGSRISYAQLMPWPRSGAAILHGPSIPSNVVPALIKYAQIELAYRAALGDLQPDLDRGGMIKSSTVDVITTVWDDKAPPEIVFPVVMGMLTPFLRVPKYTIANPFQAVPAVTSPFTENKNDFGFPGVNTTPLTEG